MVAANRLLGRPSAAAGAMSRQYNMYNVQLSEFWKQRCNLESIHNAPYIREDDDDAASERSYASQAQATDITQTSASSKLKVGCTERSSHATSLTPEARRLAPWRGSPFLGPRWSGGCIRKAFAHLCAPLLLSPHPPRAPPLLISLPLP